MSFLSRFDFQRPNGRVAVLVDAESMPIGVAAQVLAAAHGLGEPAVRRAYGALGHLRDWAEAPGFATVRAAGDSDAVRRLIGADAMAVMLTGKADCLLIASAARDFTEVVAALRQRGHRVVGIGNAGSPAPFRVACPEFVDLRPVPRVRMVRVVGQALVA